MASGLVRYGFLSKRRALIRLSLPSVQRRHFIGEILGVITRPGDTLRSLAESRKLLEEARQELQETRERAQLRPTHTFSPLPNFFPRHAELEALERALAEIPAFTILFGASSVGKTALLRQVLSKSDKYHVLHFDLRIAGFADLKSLYFSLASQMEEYFGKLKDLDGWGKEWEKEAWAFKHDRLGVERRLEKEGEKVETSDIARVMEIFQSSLLRYWTFKPEVESKSKDKAEHDPAGPHPHKGPESREADVTNKKIPVFFLDEAHKLPALIQSPEAMKILLDSMLVLTKQDRLCHVIHATSDSFYQTWLRQLNVMQHCKIISIGDCTRSETRIFFENRLPLDVPEHLQAGLDFDKLYDAFGGKLAHWGDYLDDYVNAGGNLTIEQSSHFVQAHALLNLQLVHSVNPSNKEDDKVQNFQIYSAVTQHGSPSSNTTSLASNGDDSQIGTFTADHLLTVMRRLVGSDAEKEGGKRPRSIPYFPLCRELGVEAVDAMVRGRILELRWTRTVSEEKDEDENLRIAVGPRLVPTTPILGYAMRTVLKEWEKQS
ncbi:hypothetical protein SISNIDRAFT_547505 [Sistotremastrum niveocremeum HHB9708]|uniref:ATPase domain-containing protein n=1 Tax=Sistotremastrum niveocremeum HHB9708 TaxID=1314777 RepID=A0A164YBJ7_9AGAM|nr:hypothetical protein SISNIDRAFT_547505 [Sistotremastrum niveocremeum HHB9708]